MIEFPDLFLSPAQDPPSQVPPTQDSRTQDPRTQFRYKDILIGSERFKNLKFSFCAWQIMWVIKPNYYLSLVNV